MGEMVPVDEIPYDEDAYTARYTEVEQQFVDGLVTESEMRRLQQEIADEYYGIQKQTDRKPTM